MAASHNNSGSSFSEVELDADFFVADSVHESFLGRMEEASVSIPLESIEVSRQQREIEEHREAVSAVSQNHDEAENDILQDDVIFVYRGEEAGSVPEDVTQVKVAEGTTHVAEQVFRDCNDLVSIDFPSTGLIFIGYMSFGSCWSLASISLPQSLNQIAAAFHDCQSLTEISLPLGIQIVSRWAFHDCSSLRNVVLPATLIAICENAFGHCVQLQSIELPEGLQVLQSQSFRGCKSLVLIAFPSTLKVTGENVFRGAKLLQEQLGESDGEIVQVLKSRFSYLPLNQLCYSLAYQPLETTLQKILEVLSDEKESFHVDAFGMTPFHVIGLSSSSGKTDVFQTLASHNDVYRSLLDHQDIFGKTALEYVCTKDTPEAIGTVRYVMNETISRKVSCLGLAEWRRRIDSKISLCYTEDIDRIVRLERIQEVHDLLGRYITMEKISILEQALWNAKIVQYYDNSHSMDLTAIVWDREASRIQCGADIVVPNVLSYDV